MRLQHLALLATSAVGLAACNGNDTGGITTTQPPLAYVRYVHAMPDTGIVDVRLVDKVENLNMFQLPYRSVTPYQGIAAGNRHFVVWVATTNPDPDPTVVQQKLKDTTIALEANTYYTLVETGYARAGQLPAQHIVVLLDAAPNAPAANQVSMRVVVAAPGAAAAYDVFAGGDTTTAPAGAPTFPNLSYSATLGGTNYTGFNTGAMGLQLTATGTTTPILGKSVVMAGTPASGVTSAGPGSTVPGSVLTAVVFPPGVTGSPAASTRANVSYSIDRRP